MISEQTVFYEIVCQIFIAHPRQCPIRYTELKFRLSAKQILTSSPIWDTSCLAELVYGRINRQFLCGKCPKLVTIQYLRPLILVFTQGRHLGGRAFAPWILKIVTFLCFCTQHFVFSYFAPPRKSVKIVPPPQEKTEITSLHSQQEIKAVEQF